MERINIIENELDKKKETHFIGSWNIRNDNLCKQIINFFEENKILHGKGATSLGVDQTKKKNNRYCNKPK